MIQRNHPRSILSTRVSPFTPVLAALALGFGVLSAKADPVSDLNAQLLTFAEQESTAPAPITDPTHTLTTQADPNNPSTGKVILSKAPTTITATGDDLVYAVYNVLVNNSSTYSTAADIASVVTAALETQTVNAKVVGRADLAKVVPRVINAAILATGAQNNSTVIDAIVDAAIKVNLGNTKYSLTLAEKTAAVAQGLKSAGTSTGIGSSLLDVAITDGVIPAATTKITADTQLQTFAEGVLKLVGTGTSQVASFTSEVLAKTTLQTTATAQITYTKAIADAISTNAPAVGAVYSALAQTIAPTPSTATDTTIVGTLFGDAKIGVLKDAKLAKAINVIVQDVLKSGSYSGTAANLATALVAGQSVANQGLITAGAVSSLPSNSTQTDIDTIINGVIGVNASAINKALRITATNAAIFAGSAALGTGDLSADVAVNLSKLAATPSPTTIAPIAQATLKAIAVSSPTSGEAIADQLITNFSALYPNTGTLVTTTNPQLNLAVTLAKTLPTNGVLTGAAVEGVGLHFISSVGTADQDAANLGAATIKVASKAAFNIAYDLASLPAITAGTNTHADFAAKLSVLAPTVVDKITAGVVALDAANASTIIMNVIDTSVVAGTKTTFPFKAKTLTIAASVATTADFEHLSVIAESMAGLLQSTAKGATIDPNLPKVTSLAALSTSFAKAINSRPSISTTERVDELSELAAGLTQAILTKFGGDPNLKTYLATIGTSIMSSLSAKQYENGGAFPADLQDAAQNIAGAIAQTISLDTADISSAVRSSLLTSTTAGSLELTLAKAAKTWGGTISSTGAVTAPGEVTQAFSQVAGAIGTVYQDPNVNNNKPIATGGTGRYDDGAFVDQESATGNGLGPVL